MSLYNQIGQGSWIKFKLHPGHHKLKALTKRARSPVVGKVFCINEDGSAGVYVTDLKGNPSYVHIEDIDMNKDEFFAAMIVEILPGKPN